MAEENKADETTAEEKQPDAKPETPSPPPYDSFKDTMHHINRVRALLLAVRVNFSGRASHHDGSKLASIEKELFDKYTPRLKGVTYDSPEYREFLQELKPALDHHYAANSHHPEHYANGVDGMSLLDLIEMLCDWKAAGERHADGSMQASLEKNQKRFKIGKQLQTIFENTARELNLL